MPKIAADQISNEMVLCLDFGTSFSKAFASIDHGAIPEIIDLPIGQYGGSPHALITPSEMIVDNDTIFFGASARKLFDDTEAASDRLIDSIKQYMTLGADVSRLAKIRIDAAKDPSQKFFQRDILLLYLAHLTRLTEKALEEKGYSPNVRRRFAHPAWADEKRENNKAEMKTMMAQALVLARSLGDELLESITVTRARSALDQLNALGTELPIELIAEPVREATAAGAGALLGSAENSREAYIIVDVGAGTTDVAGCYCVNNPKWSRPRVFEVLGAADAIPSAGNVLDNALAKLILEKSHLARDSAEYNAAAASLGRSKRLNKERLFQTENLLVELPTGQVVETNLGEFLNYDPVVRFSHSIKDLVAKAAFATAGDATRLTFVATGGGAKLPIVKKIADDGVTVNGKNIAFTWRAPMPTEMIESYPDLVGPYPQIAVAVGGALPELPEQRTNIVAGLEDPPRYTAGPSYKS